jgi:disulfide bond formation protein DsbB
MLNPLLWPPRLLFLLGFLACVGLLGYALYADHVLGLEPCPLCIFQRVAFILMGAVFLTAALHGPSGWGRGVYGVFAAVFGLTGAGIAARHVYLQSLPPDLVPECGPGLAYMLEAFPISRTLDMVFRGSGECAEVDWTFLGLSMPTWTLLWFLGLSVLALWAGFARCRAAATA